MDYEMYRRSYFADPAPQPRFAFQGMHGVTLYFADYLQAVSFYTQVLGPPAYLEGEFTRGWRVGDSWLTLLKGSQGNPHNVEITFILHSPQEAERLQNAFIQAGGVGGPPSDQLMYEPIRSCPVIDPFGTSILIFSPLQTGG